MVCLPGHLRGPMAHPNSRAAALCSLDLMTGIRMDGHGVDWWHPGVAVTVAVKGNLAASTPLVIRSRSEIKFWCQQWESNPHELALNGF